MTYTLIAKGPGGEMTPTSRWWRECGAGRHALARQPEIRYHKIGDKVVGRDSATLHWSTSNAKSATVAPFGSVATSGSRTVTAQPEQTHTGPVDQTITYTLTTSNACGGTTRKRPPSAS